MACGPRDKSFNAKSKRTLIGIGKINIVPQDIGQSIAEFINNAFYAVHEKKKMLDEEYEPLISVIQKKWKCEITVRDNGIGYSQKIIDKIFQPFFTTKPTGQGTGLGLSLSYDIITKEHGGEIKVETEEGEYTEFITYLPKTD